MKKTNKGKEMPATVNKQTLDEIKSIMGDKFPVMLEYYLEDTVNYIASIREGLDEKDAEKIKTPAHTIKSSSKQIGTDNLSEIAKQIESLSNDILEGKKEDFDKIEGLFKELKEAFAKAEPEIKKLV